MDFTPYRQWSYRPSLICDLSTAPSSSDQHMVTGLYTVEILLSKLYEASESSQKNVDESSGLLSNSGDQFPYTTRIYRKYIWTKQSQLDVAVKITAFPNFTQNRKGGSNTSNIKFSATNGRNNASNVHILINAFDVLPLMWIRGVRWSSHWGPWFRYCLSFFPILFVSL